MTTNFQIAEHYALTFNGRHIDLHNCFDFVGYNYDIANRQLILKWKKSKGDWVNANEYDSLQLTHSNVDYLKISYDNHEYGFPDDDKCLSDVTFYPSEDRVSNNFVLLQEEPKTGDDIIYYFQSEHFIRISCDKIELICN